jgi:hypothetical protein
MIIQAEEGVGCRRKMQKADFGKRKAGAGAHNPNKLKAKAA